MSPGRDPLPESTLIDFQYCLGSLALSAMAVVRSSVTRWSSLESVVRSLMTLAVVSVPLRFRTTPTPPAPAKDWPTEEICAWATAAT